MRTTFVLLHVPNPRMNKRIGLMKKFGDCSVLSFRRKIYDLWEPEHQDVPHKILPLDLPSAEKPLGRALGSLRMRRQIACELKTTNPDCVYTAGLDALMGVIPYKRSCGAKVVYEVADLRNLHLATARNPLKRFVQRAVSRLERRLLSDVDLIVVTSKKYYDEYYARFIDPDKVIFVPNVPDPAPFHAYQKKNSGPFTVGYIGGIRYLEQMKMLVDAAERAGARVFFAGGGETQECYEELVRYCDGKSHVEFTGTYSYESDVADLYGRADCIYSVYDASIPNVRIALPNKLYESILCELPILAAKGTYLSELVEEWGVGLSVDCESVDELECVLRRLMDDASLNQALGAALKKAIGYADFNSVDDALAQKIAAVTACSATPSVAEFV